MLTGTLAAAIYATFVTAALYVAGRAVIYAFWPEMRRWFERDE